MVNQLKPDLLRGIGTSFFSLIAGKFTDVSNSDSWASAFSHKACLDTKSRQLLLSWCKGTVLQWNKSLICKKIECTTENLRMPGGWNSRSDAGVAKFSATRWVVHSGCLQSTKQHVHVDFGEQELLRKRKAPARFGKVPELRRSQRGQKIYTDGCILKYLTWLSLLSRKDTRIFCLYAFKRHSSQAFMFRRHFCPHQPHKRQLL